MTPRTACLCVASLLVPLFACPSGAERAPFAAEATAIPRAYPEAPEETRPELERRPGPGAFVPEPIYLQSAPPYEYTDVYPVGGVRCLALDHRGSPHIGVGVGVSGGFGFPGNLFTAHLKRNEGVWSYEEVPGTFDSFWTVGGFGLDARGDAHFDVSHTDQYSFAYATNARGTWKLLDAGQEGFVLRSMGLDTRGIAHFAYLTNRTLRYTSLAEDVWTAEDVADLGFLPFSFSARSVALAVDAAGNPHVAYCDGRFPAVVRQLKYATRGANGWHIETVPVDGTIAPVDVDIAVRANGEPSIVLVTTSGSSDSVTMAALQGASWTVERIAPTPPPSVGLGRTGPAVALDSRGRAHVAFRGVEELQYARLGDNGWVVETVHASIADLRYISLAVEPSGEPHFSYLADGTQFYTRREVGGPPPHRSGRLEARAAIPMSSSSVRVEGAHPFRGGQLWFSIDVGGSWPHSNSSRDLRLHDLAGRTVKRIRWEPGPEASARAVWDGCDEHGVPVPNGIYFASTTVGGRVSNVRVSVIR